MGQAKETAFGETVTAPGKSFKYDDAFCILFNSLLFFFYFDNNNIFIYLLYLLARMTILI